MKSIRIRLLLAAMAVLIGSVVARLAFHESLFPHRRHPCTAMNSAWAIT